MTTEEWPRVVREVPAASSVPLLCHPDWEKLFPWLVQGTTARGSVDAPYDLSLFGEGRTHDVLARWEALGTATGFDRWVHGQQVHEETVRFHEKGPPGLHLIPRCDGHVTASPEVLLTAGVADCVAVSLVEPRRR